MKAKLLVVLLGLAFFYSSCDNKEVKQTDQIVDTLSKAVATDYKMMIVAKLSLKPEKVKDFIAAAKEIIEKSNTESGCSFYQLYQDPYDNSKFVFVEEYTNQAAVDAHFAAEYFNAFGPKIKDMLAEAAEIKIITVANEVIK